MISVYRSAKGRTDIVTAYEALLRQWPVPSERLNIGTAFGNTHIIRCGNPRGEPLMLRHGTSGNSATWMGDVARWAGRYRILVVDIPGEPGLSADRRLKLSEGETTRWLSEVVTFFWAPVHLVGTSLGGWMATRFTVDTPDSVSSLSLIAASGFAPQRIGFLFKAAALSLLGDWGLERVLQRVCYNAPLPPEAKRFCLLVSKHFIPVKEIVPVFSDAELSRLRESAVPVLYFGGKKDVMLRTPKSAQRISDCVPAREIHVRDTGHVIIGVAGEVADFLAGVTNPTC